VNFDGSVRIFHPQRLTFPNWNIQLRYRGVVAPDLDPVRLDRWSRSLTKAEVIGVHSMNWPFSVAG
jgi:hypothetical protein